MTLDDKTLDEVRQRCEAPWEWHDVIDHDVPALLAEVTRLRAAVERVRALHRPYIHTMRTDDCKAMDFADADDHECDASCFEEIAVCSGCGVADKWCPTLAALDGEAVDQ